MTNMLVIRVGRSFWARTVLSKMQFGVCIVAVGIAWLADRIELVECIDTKQIGWH